MLKTYSIDGGDDNDADENDEGNDGTNHRLRWRHITVALAPVIRGTGKDGSGDGPTRDDITERSERISVLGADLLETSAASLFTGSICIAVGLVD